MVSFFAFPFLIAGALAALAPVVIHLLNRRRFRVVHWAAMDFLRQAVQRRRRILRLRDLLLLALRTLAVLLFGLAMSRPFFSSGGVADTLDQPVHAVIVVDNSMSMAYERLNGTALDEARTRARDFIDRLPEGSRFSVLPLCGSAVEFSLDAYRSVRDAFEALDAIEVTDRGGTLSQAVELARLACDREVELASKRIVFLSDQQLVNWPRQEIGAQLESIGGMQAVQVAAGPRENTWIESLDVQDGVADGSSPTAFVVTLRHEGTTARRGVGLRLEVDGEPAATRTIDLEPGQARSVRFPVVLDVPTDPGRPTWAIAEASLDPDRLSIDDRRVLAVPVVASLPVVFVDRLGSLEDPARNLLGETHLLRRLMSPAGADQRRQLVEIRHLRLEELDVDSLADARLVVVAGVSRPGTALDLLREYVVQGGQLVVACGADFQAEAWSQSGWREGEGVLAGPLLPRSLGALPGEDGLATEPFFIDVETIRGGDLVAPEWTRADIESIYQAPFFFKAVAVDLSDQVLAAFERSQLERLAAPDSGDGLDRPWLLWAPAAPDTSELPAEVEARLPRVLARYTNGAPCVVERDVGRGRSVFFSSGVSSRWNTVSRTNAVLLFDRLFRAAIRRTLPRRNLDSSERVVLPVAPGERRGRFTLTRPGGLREPLAVEVAGDDRYRLVVNDVVDRGAYLVAAYPDREAQVDSTTKLWEAAIAVNGPAAESDLQLASPEVVADRIGAVRWVGADESISVEGAAVSGRSVWRWLIASVLLLLLVEMAVLARRVERGGAA